jgi:ABC-type transporter MlaC component
MKKLLLITILLVTAFAIYSVYSSESNLSKEVITLDHSIEEKLAAHVKEVQLFISKNPKYNDAVAFFIDMIFSE